MFEKDRANLLAILDAAEKIIEFTQDVLDADAFYEDRKTFDAVLMNFVVIGETVVKLKEDLKASNPQIPWANIKGFRNIIAHDYFGVDAEEVWQIIQNNIPDLINDIQAIVTIR
ncbi:MAG: DUF86 domain-containing protein [Saprospiraceae bacterium]|nr:DUF86 domain-containing protein [Saprospiraceae bacterium]